MRILYSFPHVLDRPGIAVTALNQVLSLSRLGVKITLFCASAGTIRLPDCIDVHETLSFQGLRVPHRILGVQRAYNLHDLMTAKWLSAHAGQVDLVHAWPRGCIRTIRAARTCGIVALRESPNAHTASVMRESLKASTNIGIALPSNHSHAPNLAVLESELSEYAEASYVLVPSDYARHEFLNEGYPPEKLLQHRYGCDLNRFLPRAAQPEETAPLHAVFVGRGDPTKGLHIALRAWEIARLKKATLTVTGRLEPAYAKRLDGFMRMPGVTATGFVSDIPALLMRADVLLLPSWTEGSALVIYEAQASGCLPLVSDASGAFGQGGIDFLEHKVGAADELAAQLQQIAEDRASMQVFSSRLTTRREQYSWNEAGRSLRACYAVALSGTASQDRIA